MIDTLNIGHPTLKIMQEDSNENIPVNVSKRNKFQINNGKYIIAEKEEQQQKSLELRYYDTDDKNEGDLFDLSCDFPTSPDKKTKSQVNNT